MISSSSYSINGVDRCTATAQQHLSRSPPDRPRKWLRQLPSWAKRVSFSLLSAAGLPPRLSARPCSRELVLLIGAIYRAFHHLPALSTPWTVPSTPRFAIRLSVPPSPLSRVLRRPPPLQISAPPLGSPLPLRHAPCTIATKAELTTNNPERRDWT